MQREELKFGHGSFVGAVMRDPTFFEMSAEDQARILGWADSCPVVNELIEERGAEAMRDRYGEVNFWFGELNRLIGEVNPDLQHELMWPQARLDSEPIGKHERQSVPTSAISHMSPMGKLVGHVLPRLFIEQLGIHEDLPKHEIQDRLIRGIDIIGRAATLTKSPSELLAYTAEGILLAGDVTPETVLKQVFSKGWLDEHNGRSDIAHFRGRVYEVAPTLWQAYDGLPETQKVQLA